ELLCNEARAVEPHATPAEDAQELEALPVHECDLREIEGQLGGSGQCPLARASELRDPRADDAPLDPEPQAPIRRPGRFDLEHPLCLRDLPPATSVPPRGARRPCQK